MNGNSTGIVLDLHQIIDLSEDGMSFQSSGAMEVGESLNFSVDLSDPKFYFHIIGRVVWSNPSGRTGIRFQKTAPEDAVKLREWLFANAFAGITPDDQITQFGERPIRSEPYAGVPENTPVEETPFPIRTYVSGLLAAEAVKQEVVALAFDLDSALQIVVQRVLSLSRATGAAVALSDEKVSNENEMICRATSGPDAPPLGARLQVGSGFSGECVRTGQLLHCNDSELDDRVDRESCRALGIRSIMAAPIRSSHAVIGLVEIFSPDPGAFGDGDKSVLQGMAEIVQWAVHRATQAGGHFVGLLPLQQLPRAEFVASVEPVHGADLAQFLEETPPNIARPESVQTSPPRRISRVPWILLIAILTAISVASWLIVSGWPGGVFNSQGHFTEQSRQLNRQATLEQSGLQDLRNLASQGDTLAEFTLGLRYATGSNAPRITPRRFVGSLLLRTGVM